MNVESAKGVLYIVHVPSGEWEGVTLRARRMLRTAALVVVRGDDYPGENLTRTDVSVPLFDLDRDTHTNGVQVIRDALLMGDVVWVLPDVTVWVQADGALLGALLAQDVEVSPLPGASDLMTAIVLSGLPADRFSFLGAMPSLPEARRALLARVAREQHTLVCTVRGADVAGVLGDVTVILGDRRVAVYGEGRVWRGRAGKALAWTRDVVLVVEGAVEGLSWPEEQVRNEVRSRLAKGESPRDVARVVARHAGWRRKAVYQMTLETSARLRGQAQGE